MTTFQIEQIPPLPGVALQVMKFDPSNPDSSIEMMEAIIAPDKGITSEILKIANSALYGRSGRIKTIRDAITLLGVKTVKNLVIMLTTRRITSKLQHLVFKKYLQEYPVLAALIALDIAKPMGLREIKDEAFLAALLNKIGMSIIALQETGDYEALLHDADEGKLEQFAEEQKRFGTNHLEVGKMVFDAWKLPPMYAETVAGSNFAPQNVADVSDLTRVTSLSLLLSSKLLSLPVSAEDQARMDSISAHHGLGPEKLEVFNQDYFKNMREHPFYQQATA